MYHLIKALYYSVIGRSAYRRHKLLAQYHRAMALPRFGSRTIENGFASTQKKSDMSVIITSFNYSNYIEQAIESVFHSKIGDLSIELIVIDDSSKDSSFKVVMRALESAPIPMRLIRNYWNVGVSKSRNIGINAAKGDFIFILDADNFIFPGALLSLYQVITRAFADAAYGPIKRYKTDGALDGVVSNKQFDASYLFSTGNYIDAMAMFRRSTLYQLGGYEVSLLRRIGGWEDYALWLEFANQGSKVAFTPEQVGIYRVKSDSMVNQITPQEIEEFRKFATKRYPQFTAFSEKA